MDTYSNLLVIMPSIIAIQTVERNKRLKLSDSRLIINSSKSVRS